MGLKYLKTAVRIILPLWMVIKIVCALVTFLSAGAVDLTFMNPAVELGFNALVFIKDTSLGLGVFIGFVVVIAVGVPMSFLVIPDSKVQNIIGFFAYAIVTLTDIVSVFILGFNDGMFILSLILHLLLFLCLLFYGKIRILNRNEADADAIPLKTDADREDAENNS